jgi:hypothetical protein
MKQETAGDPITGLKWTRKTTEKIAVELGELGIRISANTVGRLLKQMDFSLRVNHKKLSCGTRTERTLRDEQFCYIAELRERFVSEGNPIISVDAKKRELVGNFKNDGKAWNREPVLVNDHDFPSYARGHAIPYGIYDTIRNRGTVFIGTSFDTADFAVESIEKWWRSEGKHYYPHATSLLILADGGGSNGTRVRAWKHALQHKMCNRHGISITVAHYPTGASKWNPIEHRLFSEISKNWAGKPLDGFETIKKYIQTTTTSTGLQVNAHFVWKQYDKGISISDEEMLGICIEPHAIQPARNYTLNPCGQNGK